MATEIILKRCGKCKTRQPTSQFYKNRSRPDGLQERCKSCIDAWSRSDEAKTYRQKRVSRPKQLITERECLRCRVIKPATEFYKDTVNPFGRGTRCKTCIRIVSGPPKNRSKIVETACADCGKKEMRRGDYIKSRWNGRCRKCASKINNNRPEIASQRAAKRLQTMNEWPEERKAAFAEHARQQVLQQGGVPNAKPFVREGEEGRRMAGDNHYAWKGGVTPENQRERSSAKYAEWRTAVLRRDNFTCQLCGIRGGRLQADHILSWAAHKELRFELSNGRTLCVPCHKKTPNYGWRGRASA